MPVKEDGLKLEYRLLTDIVKWPRNPKEHSSELGDAFKEFGFLVPMLIDETSGRLVAGHGRLEHLQKLHDEGSEPPQGIKVIAGKWRVPVIRGGYFDSEEQAERFLLSDNLLQMAGGWNEGDLEEIVSEVSNLFGTESLEKVVEDLEGLGNVEDITEGMNEVDLPNLDEGSDEKKEKKLDSQQKYDQLPDELEGVFELSPEAYFPPEEDDFSDRCIGDIVGGKPSKGPNSWGVPNLRPDMLVESLPDNLLMWGDRQSTPDDGNSYYLFNYGATPWEGLPFDRSIYAWFTHDTNIESWWMNPDYRVGQMIRLGSRAAIVPDYSLWDHSPRVLKLYSIYRSMWLGRYFQETRMIKVIPRIEFFMEDAELFSLSGIPFNAPVVATQMQTDIPEEHESMIQKKLSEAIDIIKPKQLLVVASSHGEEVIRGAKINCDVRILPPASKLRKTKIRKKEEDPYLLELKKRKRGMKESSRITTPEK